MLRIIANRVLVAIPTLILVSMLIFGLQKLLPGDPVTAMAGEDQDPQLIASLRVKYHLDEPVPAQYALWVRDVVHGDLGASLRTDVPVTSLIAQKLPVTLQLAAMAMIFAYFATSRPKNAASSSGVLPTGSAPSLTRCFRTSGSASPFTVSA